MLIFCDFFRFLISSCCPPLPTPETEQEAISSFSLSFLMHFSTCVFKDEKKKKKKGQKREPTSAQKNIEIQQLKRKSQPRSLYKRNTKEQSVSTCDINDFLRKWIILTIWWLNLKQTLNLDLVETILVNISKSFIARLLNILLKMYLCIMRYYDSNFFFWGGGVNIKSIQVLSEINEGGPNFKHPQVGIILSVHSLMSFPASHGGFYHLQSCLFKTSKMN